MDFQRASGILLHPTSFPGKYGIGDLGDEAYKFIDFLKNSGQKLWQVLPLGPTGYGNSPYASYSAFAGNTYLISPDLLAEDGYLSEEDLSDTPEFSNEKVEYEKVISFKNSLYLKAFENFKLSPTAEDAKNFSYFCNVNASWLHDFSIFMAVKEYYENESKKSGTEGECITWVNWEHSVLTREESALHWIDKTLGNEIFFHKFLQYQFYKQWLNLKEYANKNNVLIIGDIPIFVAHDSADVWAHPDIFHLDENLVPVEVAGVPPDYFSETGQLWGNPLYDWKELSHRDFDWWISRFKSCFTLADIVRVDHFRGFDEYWAVPYGSENAIKGKWKKAAGMNLFKTVEKYLGKLPIIAEDLGIITPQVEALRDKFHFPGMKILQFAFGGDPKEKFLPHNHIKNCVVYPGTHDNDTCLGWYNTCPEKEKDYFQRYTNSDGKEIHWDFIKLGMSSVADMTLFALQDILGLDTIARMNTPSKPDGNWEWRFTWDMINPEITSRLKQMAHDFGR